ncbi:MAG: hypothetical protein ABIJ21_08535 [Nanoarchaeota archaeon]
MRIPKVYGQSRMEGCIFCNARALSMNSQKIPTCVAHKNREVLDWKCACGDWLDIKNGKYGAFFTCMKCGIVSIRKAREINFGKIQEEGKEEESKERQSQTQKTKRREDYEPKEITIRSDDPDYF